MFRKMIENLLNAGIKSPTDADSIRFHRTINGLNAALFLVALFGIVLVIVFNIALFLVVVEIVSALGYFSGLISAYKNKINAAKYFFIYTFEFNAFAVSLFLMARYIDGQMYSLFLIGFIIFPFLALVAETSVLLHAMLASLLGLILVITGWKVSYLLDILIPSRNPNKVYICYVLSVILFPFVGAIVAAILRRENKLAKRKIAKTSELLKLSNRELEKRNREILEYTNTITHDLKKPLTAIKTICSIMNSQALEGAGPEIKGAVKVGDQSVEYMQTLLDDLLVCAKLEAGTQELQKEKTNMRTIVSGVVESLTYQIKEKNIEIKNLVSGIEIFADPKELKKVFMNLIGNAINYIGAGTGKEIEIGCNERADYCEFYVQDNGIGIPESDQKNIFEKFRRGANVKGISGTGLGLAIVKGIVEAHGGKVRVESEEGKGSAFYFTLR